jgi:hypothetical protein
MRKKIPITFPNEPYPIEVPVDINKLVVNKIFKNRYWGDIIFCWYDDIYISINSKSLDSETLAIIIGNK